MPLRNLLLTLTAGVITVGLDARPRAGGSAEALDRPGQLAS